MLAAAHSSGRAAAAAAAVTPPVEGKDDEGKDDEGEDDEEDSVTAETEVGELFSLGYLSVSDGPGPHHDH